MREEKGGSPIGVGVLTILTVLLVLTLAVFSALTFSSARADLSLSEINADTVAAYYRADGEAARVLSEFRSGLDEELEMDIPMTETQSLYLHLFREPDGAVRVLAWKTRSNGAAEGEVDLGGDSLPIFDGTLPVG